MENNLRTKTIKELQDFISLAQEIITEKKRDEKKALVSKISDMVQSHGFSLDDVFPNAVRSKSVVPPKYRNPQDAKKTWSGRGKRPKWFQLLLDQGYSEEELRIS